MCIRDRCNQFNWLIVFKHQFRLIIWRKIPKNVHFRPNQPLKWPNEPPVTPLWVYWNRENWWKGLIDVISIENRLKTIKHNFRLKNGPEMPKNAFLWLIILKTGSTHENGEFLALLVLGSAHISEKTTYNWGIVVLLRGRTSVSEMRISIYGIILK